MPENIPPGVATRADPTVAADASAVVVLRVPRRFNGPPTSGNGGWVGGALARYLPAGPVSVSLRAPVPLDVDLVVRPRDGAAPAHAGPSDGPGALVLLQGEGPVDRGDRVVAEAESAAPWSVALPALPDDDRVAEVAALARIQARRHGLSSPYARCFACGFARDDGLCIVPGPVDAMAGVVAAHWVPAAELADDAGDGETGAETAAPVRPEAVWAALDCPAGIAWGCRLGEGLAMVTVRMAVEICAPVRVGERYRVIGWALERDGRKLHAATALVDAGGQVVAHSRQLWLLPRDAAV